MIRCILCHGTLNLTSTGYSCNSCQKQYPTINGITQFRDEKSDEEYYFPDGGFDLLYNSEEKSFWFQVRNLLLGEVLDKYISKDKRLLEVGCGTGFVAGYLKKMGYRIECADLFLDGLKYCQMRGSGYAYYQYNLYDEVFFEEFDGIIACDVIEHLEDDKRALLNLNRSLNKGGVLVLTVPACKSIRSSMDDYSGHKRRYSRRDLNRKLEAAGFNVVKISYFMMLLFPAIALSRMVVKWKNVPGEGRAEVMRSKARDELSITPFLNSLFARIFSIEIPIIRYMDLPIGSSLVAVAIKGRSP
jgi:2-polyprenyl-3-methyl-5-hydroxy-6-metoxy-1,4-benzoquinol methylase